MANRKGDIGLIGLAVMGQNLILNMADHGFTVVAFNRSVGKVHHFLANEAKNKSILGAESITDLVGKLKKPRMVMMLVKAGPAVDSFIEQLLPYLEHGDVIIDGGNSEYVDTQRRCKYLAEKCISFVGCGVSGGEDGARYGPSLMPGGAKAAWQFLKPIFHAISAKVENQQPCCDWVGADGSGHFVKMVHNGIEYGDMQLICEAYHLMRAIGMTQDEMADVFAEWNKSELDSFLIDITKDILKFKDKDGQNLLPRIHDAAGQKGTGKWTAISALNYGVPVTLIGEAVFSRCLSALKSEREDASRVLPGPVDARFVGDRKQFLDDLKHALYASKIVSYAQGFMLLREAAAQHSWELDYGSIALMWRGGCIIRSVFLGQIKAAFDAQPQLRCLLLAPFFLDALAKAQNGWRSVIVKAVELGVPTPAFSTALAFYDGYRCKNLPANLLQAQRDYFGAHTYELLGKEGTFVHTNWTGHGGNVSASTYDA